MVVMACSLIQVRFVTPTQLGTLQSYAIVTSYLTFMHFGTFTALQRELPYLVGQGKAGEAKKLAAVCQGWILLMASASVFTFVVMAVWSACQKDFTATSGWMVQAVAIFFSLYTGYLAVTYRTSAEFAVLAKTGVKVSLLSILTLPLLVVNAYYGMCLRNAINSCLQGLLLHLRRPLLVRPSLDWRVLKALISFGLPLSVFGYVETSLWSATQNYLVFTELGARGLGLLAFTLAAQTALLIVPQSINQIYMPRIAQQYGSCSDLRAIVRLCVKPTAASFSVSCMAVLCAWFCIKPACRLLTPKYIDAVSAVQWALLIMPLVSLRLPQYILIATRRRRAYALSTIIGFSIGIGLLILVLRAGFGLQAVVLAYLGGYLAMVVTSLIQIALALIRKSPTETDGMSKASNLLAESTDAAAP